MTLSKAMQIDRQILDGKDLPSIADRNAAIALGYEAMQAVLLCRASHMFCPGMLLPGEDEPH